jgi:plastocyanin
MKLLVSVVSLGALFALAGCTEGESTPSPAPTPTPSTMPPPADMLGVPPSDMRGVPPADMATPPSTFPMTASVAVGPNNSLTYAPQSVDIARGGTVTWNWQGTLTHTVTSDSSLAFDSGVRNPGSTFSFTFATAGSFPYHCLVHGTIQSGMIVVH